MLALYIVGTTYVVPFVEDKIDQVHTGDGRLSQVDLNVGHGGTSHFLTQFWHNTVIVIEFPNGDATKGKVYTAQVTTTGSPKIKRVVTLTTGVFNSHGKPGYPDIAASVTGFAVPVIFYNTGNGFSTEAV